MKTGAILAGLALCGVASAAGANVQNINVTVDGEVVPFSGQQPVEQDGSVLVPLRGVFERLGATVAYDGSTKTILAVKGGTAVSLRLGSATASVNGQNRSLSRPAQAVNGTTLVPLRFVSEALGASVKWSGASRTVIIATTGAPTTPGTPEATPTGALSVTSLEHNAARPLRAGQTLTITLTGTPGGMATFTIPGIEQAKNVPMRETATGTYTGTISMPSGVNVKNASVLATLRKGTQAAPTIQAAQPVTIDTVAPTVENLSPAPNASLTPGRPVIYGTFSDAGTGVEWQSTKIFVNGKDVSEQATITAAFVSYKPEADLAPGRDMVAVVTRDHAGNETRKEWAFTVVAQESLIKSVGYSPNAKALEPGDVLTVKMMGKPGGQAKFSIGGIVTGRPMQEQTPGEYVGSYTVKKGDSLAKAPVSVSLTDNGRTVTQSADGGIDIAAGAPDMPTITAPVAGANVGETFTLAGKARPGATVRYTVRYSGQLLILPVSGAIADGEVKANEKGEWRVEGIKLSAPTGVSKLTYQVAAVSVGGAGETSDPTTVDFRR